MDIYHARLSLVLILWFLSSFSIAQQTPNDAWICESGDCQSGSGVAFSDRGRIGGRFTSYSGTFSNGQITGEGTLRVGGSTSYTGGVLNGFPHGEGELRESQQPVYKGEWKEGNYHGSGSLYSRSNVLIYEGQFREGEWHGVGTSYSENGSVDKYGEWNNGRLARVLVAKTKITEQSQNQPNGEWLTRSNYTFPFIDDYSEPTREFLSSILFGDFNFLLEGRNQGEAYNIQASLNNVYIGFVREYSVACDDYLPVHSDTITTTTYTRTVNSLGVTVSEEDPYVSRILQVLPQLSDKYLQLSNEGERTLKFMTGQSGTFADILLTTLDIRILFNSEVCTSVAVQQFLENIYRITHGLPSIQKDGRVIVERGYSIDDARELEIDIRNRRGVIGQWDVSSSLYVVNSDGTYRVHRKNSNEILRTGTWIYDARNNKLIFTSGTPGVGQWLISELAIHDLSKKQMRANWRQGIESNIVRLGQDFFTKLN